VPASLIAAAVLLTLFVPGYLFQAGVREYNAVLTAERDVYAVAQAVAISTGFLLFLFIVLKLISAGSVQDDLLHNPAANGAQGLSDAQAILLAGLLLFSNASGKAFGWLMSRGRKGRLEDQSKRGLLWLVSAPLRVFFAPSSLDRQIEAVIRTTKKAGSPTYVRLIRQGQEDVLGVIDGTAADASASSLGSGLALSARWAYVEGKGWQTLGGAHLPKVGVIEILSWNSAQRRPKPAWLEQLDGVEP
jgi:hypothetical protein